MKQLLKEALQPENIFLDLEAEDAHSLIRDIASRLNGDESVRDVIRLADDAIAREEEMPTGISDGIALPHARTGAVQRLLVAFVRMKNGIDFKSPDGIPSDLVFFSAVPHSCIDEYLKLTAHLVRLLHRQGVADKLRKAKTCEDVVNALGLDD